MTDKPTPEETPTERLLREALNARASLVTAQSLRQDTPPSRRLRRLRPVLTVTVPLLGLAAAVAIGVVRIDGDQVAKRDDTPPAATLTATPSPSVSTSASPSPSATESDSPEAPAATAGTPYEFQKVGLEVPAGWRTVTRSDDRDIVCLLSPGAPATATASDCQPYGVEIAAYSADSVKDATWPTEGALDAEDGWSHQPFCALWDNPHGTTGGPDYHRIGQPQRSVQSVNGRWLSMTKWQVGCEGQQFTARMWGFHKEQVFVVANGLKSDYEDGLTSIINSLDVSRRGDVLGKGKAGDIKVQFGEPTSTTADATETVTFQVTWTNVGQTSYSHVEPVVAGQHDEQEFATPTGPVEERIPTGTLERKDGSSWTALPLRMGTGMDYAGLGRSAAFSLAPGKSRTVTYRMKLTTKDHMASLNVVGQAFLDTSGGSYTEIGDVASYVPIHPGS
ncbi:hypothetical protein BX265_3572 [Streptomyces sp. TLI_235]|nr:hypothetical protein [Streptomyces sp. TLI_235]PBC78791.1 hypothetical protein BX265_3572 [Streptomyces sp. TLI_235]